MRGHPLLCGDNDRAGHRGLGFTVSPQCKGGGVGRGFCSHNKLYIRMVSANNLETGAEY